MPDDYKDFQREPSKPHQCMHHYEKDGTRCHAMAMHNEYMCYAHRSDEIATVIQNDMFLIENLDTHAAIQKAYGDIAHRLACNHIDLKRAQLLITTCRGAARNLRDAGCPIHDRLTVMSGITTSEPATEPYHPERRLTLASIHSFGQKGKSKRRPPRSPTTRSMSRQYQIVSPSRGG